MPHSSAVFFLCRWARAYFYDHAGHKLKMETVNELPKVAMPFCHELHKEHVECAICMETFVKGTELKNKVIVAPCDIRHFFHAECLQKWVTKTPSCPLCKTVFNLADLVSHNRLMTEGQMRRLLGIISDKQAAD